MASKPSKVSGDVENEWCFYKGLPKFENSSFDAFKTAFKRFFFAIETLRKICSVFD